MENDEAVSNGGNNGFVPLVTVVGFHHARCVRICFCFLARGSRSADQ